jgi:hypothetical protein
MPKPIIKFDETKLIKNMVLYEKVIGKEVGQQVRNFSRVLGLELMRNSQPNWEKNGKNEDALIKSKEAISKDIHQYLIPLRSFWMDAFKEAKSLGLSLHKKDGTPWLTDEYRFAKTVKEVLAWYKPMRSKRTGRPPKRGSKTIGRHTAAMYLVVPKELVAAIKQKMQLALGKSRAGWAKAAQDCKADTKAAAKGAGIPKWVQRHMDKSTGSAKQMQQSFFGGGTAGEMRIILRSGVPWAGRLLTRKVIADTANIVRSNMAKFIQRTIRAELKKRAKAS